MSELEKYTQFVTAFATLLEVDVTQINDRNLSEIPSYDSLAKIQVATLIDRQFGHFISQEVLEACSSVREIFDVANNFRS